MAGLLSDDELAALKVRNDARVAALAAQGVQIIADRGGHYTLLLIEALCGPGVVRRCQEDNEHWFADLLDEAEPEAQRALREAQLLGTNGAGPQPGGR